MHVIILLHTVGQLHRILWGREAQNWWDNMLPLILTVTCTWYWWSYRSHALHGCIVPVFMTATVSLPATTAHSPHSAHCRLCPGLPGQGRGWRWRGDNSERHLPQKLQRGVWTRVWVRGLHRRGEGVLAHTVATVCMCALSQRARACACYVCTHFMTSSVCDLSWLHQCVTCHDSISVWPSWLHQCVTCHDSISVWLVNHTNSNIRVKAHNVNYLVTITWTRPNSLYLPTSASFIFVFPLLSPHSCHPPTPPHTYSDALWWQEVLPQGALPLGASTGGGTEDRLETAHQCELGHSCGQPFCHSMSLICD